MITFGFNVTILDISFQFFLHVYFFGMAMFNIAKHIFFISVAK